MACLRSDQALAASGISSRYSYSDAERRLVWPEEGLGARWFRTVILPFIARVLGAAVLKNAFQCDLPRPRSNKQLANSGFELQSPESDEARRF